MQSLLGSGVSGTDGSSNSGADASANAVASSSAALTTSHGCSVQRVNASDAAALAARGYRVSSEALVVIARHGR